MLGAGNMETKADISPWSYRACMLLDLLKAADRGLASLHAICPWVIQLHQHNLWKPNLGFSIGLLLCQTFLRQHHSFSVTLVHVAHRVSSEERWMQRLLNQAGPNDPGPKISTNILSKWDKLLCRYLLFHHINYPGGDNVSWPKCILGFSMIC